VREVRTFAQIFGRQCQRRSSPLLRAGDLNREWFAVCLGRRAGAALDGLGVVQPVGQAAEAEAMSTSKSAVSRKFVAMTEAVLADLLATDLSGLDLVALMIDGSVIEGFVFGGWLVVAPPSLSHRHARR
jgi:hypothetical protein